MDIKKNFEKKIKPLRIEKARPQEKLALCADLYPAYLASIEKGEKNVSFTVLEKIVKAYQVRVSELFKD